MEQLERTKKTGFDKGDGVFAKALDDALASFNVERQAYYSGSFIGNHVHRCLQVHTCICICTSNHTHVCTCKTNYGKRTCTYQFIHFSPRISTLFVTLW